MEIFDCFIDKLTIVGNLNIDLEYALQNLISEPHVYIKGTPTTSCVEGNFFSYGYAESVHFTYDAVNSNAMSKRNFRMEFNPNKISLDQENWLKEKVVYLLDDIGFSRFDLACDCDFDLSDFSFVYNQPLKRGCWYGLDGKLETMYYGSRNSDVFRRIYNKRAEVENKNKKISGENSKIIKRNSVNQLSAEKLGKDFNPIPYLPLEPVLKSVWWRFEYELKNANSVDQLIDLNLPLFDDLRVFKPDYEELSINDEIYLKTLLNEPEMLNKLSKNAKTKYRKLMREMQSELDITDLFRKKVQEKTPELLEQLNSWRKNII
jgi:hypothetical protein